MLPGLYHLLVLGSTNLSLLNKLDITVRAAVRKWLDLPKDVPNAYFHADVKDGGLSIPSFRWIAPLQRLNRLRNLQKSEGYTEAPQAMEAFLEIEIKQAQERLKDQGDFINSLTACKARFARILHQSNDGKPLIRSSDVIQQHRWVTDGNLLLSGREFVHMNKLRINAIPLKVRTSRGRIKRETDCRGGCKQTETLEHVLQVCHRTHAPRIQRHDNCLNYILKKLPKICKVHEEPKFKTPEGLKKPDAIIIRGEEAILIDAQIVGERTDLDRQFRIKREKYQVLTGDIMNRYSVKHVTFTALTISSRGIWSKQSYEHLTKLNLIKNSDVKLLSIKVLTGGIKSINIFNSTTATRRRTHDDHG